MNKAFQVFTFLEAFLKNFPPLLFSSTQFKPKNIPGLIRQEFNLTIKFYSYLVFFFKFNYMENGRQKPSHALIIFIILIHLIHTLTRKPLQNYKAVKTNETLGSHLNFEPFLKTIMGKLLSLSYSYMCPSRRANTLRQT